MIQSGFFNSVNGDRRYNADFFARFFGTLIGNGVFPNPSTGLQVYESSNMTVTVKPGKGWINGYFIISDSEYNLTLDTADGVLNRIDRIVMRLDFASREIKIAVKKGTFASSPVAPTLQRDADAYELALADIYVGKGVTAITQSNINDQRLNTSVCGIVKGLIDQVDTTTIFNQYQAWYQQVTGSTQAEIDAWQAQQEQAFNDWFATVQNTLSGDVAGNLASQITTLQQDFAAHQTDFTNLSIGKKITLNVTSDYAGKVTGSTVKNPNISRMGNSASLQNPITTGFLENGQISYDKIKTSDNNLATTSTAVANSYAEHIFSFNIIEILTRKYGVEIFDGATTLTEKIAKAKTIISDITCNWWGYGSGPLGNKAYFRLWNNNAWETYLIQSTTKNTVSKLSIKNISSHTGTLLVNSIDSNGFAHFLAYADPSDGTIASVINTDYVSLNITVSVSALIDHKADLVSHGIYGVATGANTLVMTNSNVTAYVEGMLVAFKNTTANTSAVTLNINSLGAKAIKKANGNALTSGNLKAGGIYQLRYDGSSFILLGEGGEYGTATASDVLIGKTLGTDNGIVSGLFSVIKSIQRINFVMTDISVTRTIASIDTSKSIVLITSYPTQVGYANGNDVNVTAKIASSTSVQFNKESTAREMNICAIVIEFNGVKSLQTGTATIANGSTVSIGNVNINKSLLFFSYRDTVNNSSVGDNLLEGYISNSTSLYFFSNNSSKKVEWQVIEFV